MSILAHLLILSLIVTYSTLLAFGLTDQDIKDKFKVQDKQLKDAVDAWRSRAGRSAQKESTSTSSEVNATSHCQSPATESKSDVYYVFSLILLTLHGVCLILASCSYFFWDVSRTTRFKKTLSIT